ncbi:MAG: ADP-ribosylglycohydrolase family protein [Planctomycetaceae bacterium]|nr:ADP-ribosylglycohydrolase family protein [Planctomycetaceae bacterium]
MSETTDQVDRFRGCLLGLAAGDAVGTTVEFALRGSFNPVSDMVGGGPFGLRPGEWTDDTSMALCLAASLLERGGFDARDQMERYCRWWQDGYMSSTGRCFDIGNTVRGALMRYQQTGDPFAGSLQPHTAGNASIMRLAPAAMYWSSTVDDAIKYCGESSRTTHGAAECIDACRYLGLVLWRALWGMSKEEILADCGEGVVTARAIRALAAGSYRWKSVDEVRGSGYVVQSLEAALWCFWRSESFEESVLTAVNLGEDADTTGAICGQMAGAFYGESGIPRKWVERLVLASEILAMADRLGARSDPAVFVRFG